jgi:hypothetical protein
MLLFCNIFLFVVLLIRIRANPYPYFSTLSNCEVLEGCGLQCGRVAYDFTDLVSEHGYYKFYLTNWSNQRRYGLYNPICGRIPVDSKLEDIPFLPSQANSWMIEKAGKVTNLGVADLSTWKFGQMNYNGVSTTAIKILYSGGESCPDINTKRTTIVYYACSIHQPSHSDHLEVLELGSCQSKSNVTDTLLSVKLWLTFFFTNLIRRIHPLHRCNLQGYGTKSLTKCSDCYCFSNIPTVSQTK